MPFHSNEVLSILEIGPTKLTCLLWIPEREDDQRSGTDSRNMDGTLVPPLSDLHLVQL